MLKNALLIVQIFMTTFANSNKVGKAFIAVSFIRFVMNMEFAAVSMADNAGVVISWQDKLTFALPSGCVEILLVSFKKPCFWEAWD